MTKICPKFFAPQAHRCAARSLLVAAALLASTAAAAADFSVGLGSGLDQGKVDCVASFACDRSSSYAKFYGGYQVTEAIDVQLVYFGAGRFKGGDTTPLGTQFGGTFKVNGFGVTAGYRWEFAPSWSAFAYAGLASVRTRFDYASEATGSVSQTTIQPLLGLGLAFAITPSTRLGLDYVDTRMKVHTTRGSLRMLGLAAQFSF